MLQNPKTAPVTAATADMNEGSLLDEGSLLEERRAFSQILGLDDLVSEEVMIAALTHKSYAQNLLVARRSAPHLTRLLQNPPQPAQEKRIPALELVSRAATSLARWSATGFSTVDEATYARRLEACRACPNLIAPPDRQATLYRLAGAGQAERTVCAKCGCVVKNKARRSTDTCPAPAPDNPGLNFWGEPLPAPAR